MKGGNYPSPSLSKICSPYLMLQTSAEGSIVSPPANEGASLICLWSRSGLETYRHVRSWKQREHEGWYCLLNTVLTLFHTSLQVMSAGNALPESHSWCTLLPCLFFVEQIQWRRKRKARNTHIYVSAASTSNNDWECKNRITKQWTHFLTLYVSGTILARQFVLCIKILIVSKRNSVIGRSSTKWAYLHEKLVQMQIPQLRQFLRRRSRENLLSHSMHSEQLSNGIITGGAFA